MGCLACAWVYPPARTPLVRAAAWRHSFPAGLQPSGPQDDVYQQLSSTPAAIRGTAIQVMALSTRQPLWTWKVGGRGWLHWGHGKGHGAACPHRQGILKPWSTMKSSKENNRLHTPVSCHTRRLQNNMGIRACTFMHQRLNRCRQVHLHFKPQYRYHPVPHALEGICCGKMQFVLSLSDPKAVGDHAGPCTTRTVRYPWTATVSQTAWMGKGSKREDDTCPPPCSTL